MCWYCYAVFYMAMSFNMCIKYDSNFCMQQIYSTKPQRHNSGDPIDSKMDRQVRTPSYYPSTSYSPQSPLDRISVTSSTLFDRHAPIYEPKVQTLPNQNG